MFILLRNPWFDLFVPPGTDHGCDARGIVDLGEMVTGALFSKIRKLKRVVPPARVRDPEEGQRLWELSERLIAKRLALAAETTR